MELVPALPPSMPLTSVDSATPLEATPHKATAESNTADETPRRATQPRFADILGQTLAGPLFAIWPPRAEIVATDKPAATHANVAALDNSGRRDGRKRSRR